MKSLIFLNLLFICCTAQAGCSSDLPLKGIHNVENCKPSSEQCVQSDKALFQYMNARKDEEPDLLVIGLHGSPWHAYGADFHILEIGDLARIVKQQGTEIHRVRLLSSWSAIAPDQRSKSLALRLSDALNGTPVDGEDGFVWLRKDGFVQTTHQAFTTVRSGPYWVAEGEQVMASMVVGWPAQFESEFAKRQDADGLMRAGVGFDVFMLCPARALKAFEAGAALSNPIAAYNAAIMRLERGEPGDSEAATALLKRSAALGDQMAEAKLNSIAKLSPQAGTKPFMME